MNFAKNVCSFKKKSYLCTENLSLRVCAVRFSNSVLSLMLQFLMVFCEEGSRSDGTLLLSFL